MTVWHDVSDKWLDHKGVTEIDWKTTPGMGDVMYGLNIAFMRAFINQKVTTLNLHWYHSDDYLYYFEDPETLMFRADYVKSRYMWPEMVKINHIFNSTDMSLYNLRYRNVKRILPWMARQWMFSDRYDSVAIQKKMVIWRPSFNADAPRWFKMPWNDSEWIFLVEAMKNCGYNVVEIDYRTPVSEAFYHIRTCEIIICYEGMWHYIAKNFFKPLIVVSDQNVTKWHTPTAYRLNGKDSVYNDIDMYPKYIQRAKILADNYRRSFRRFVLNEH